MKKAKDIIVCFIILAILLMIAYTSTSEHINHTKENAPNPLKEYFAKNTKEFTVKNCPVLDKAWATFLDENSKTLPGKEIYYTKGYTPTAEEKKEVKEFNIKNYHSFYESVIFKNLETSALRNDECGVKSSSLASIIYYELKMDDKEKESHQRLVKFADTNNLHATNLLCSYGSSADEKIRFCSIVYYQNHPIFDKESKEQAETLLINAYKEKKQPAKIASICKVSINKEHCYQTLAVDTRFTYYFQTLTKSNSSQSVSLQKQFIAVWEDIYFDESQSYYEDTKKSATNILKDLYYHLRDIDSMKKLYKNTSDPSDKSSIAYSLSKIADELYTHKKYDQAYPIFNEIADDDKYGLVGFALGEMNLRGQGTKKDLSLAIKHYKHALFNIKNNSLFRSEIFNQIGAAYFGLLNYTEAFNNFYKSATMGMAKAQLNLAEMYTDGQGTLQDFKQAFAWDSVAVTQGLGDADDQNRAIHLKNALHQELMRRSAKDLNEANALAKQYYKQYVLHEDEPVETE